jgi:hypothetical protein
MKKLVNYGILLLVLSLALFIASCSSGEGGDTPHNPELVEAVYLGGHTLNNRGNTSTFIYSTASSKRNIRNNSPRKITLPDSSEIQYTINTGAKAANKYYFGNSITNRGSIIDPFTETTRRQLFAYHPSSSVEPWIYTIAIGSQSKEVLLAQGSYLPALNINNVSTNPSTPNNILNVLAGDTITLSGQNNSGLRYLCRIYDTALNNDHTLYNAYWTSADIRNMDLTSVESIRDFVLYQTEIPVGDQVSFTIPGTILSTGNGFANLLVIITGYDTSYMNADTDGDFQSLIFPQTELVMEMQGI